MKSGARPRFRRPYRGKAVIPVDDETRERMDIAEGDVFLARVHPANRALFVERVEHPIDFLGIEAIAEHEAGLTVSLDEVAAELGIEIDRGDQSPA